MNSLALRLRKGIYRSLFWFDQIIGMRPAAVVIFCYHSIASDDWRFSVDQLIFEAEIEELLRKRKPITTKDLEGHLSGIHPITEPSFLLCFDDGYQDILSVKDFLAERGILPVLFVLSHTGEADYTELGTKRTFLSVEEVQSLRASGWAIGSHGATHRDFYALSEAEKEFEIAGSKERLETTLGFPIPYFAYPRGRYTKEVLKSVKQAGYSLGFSMDDGTVDMATPRYALPRIGVDRTHDIGEFPALSTPSAIRFRQFIKYLMS